SRARRHVPRAAGMERQPPSRRHRRRRLLRRHLPALRVHPRPRRLDRTRVGALGLTVALMVGACGSGAATKPLPLRRVTDIPLPGRTTRFDYADVDTARHLLVVAHLGDNDVIAVDLASRRVTWIASS